MIIATIAMALALSFILGMFAAGCLFQKDLEELHQLRLRKAVNDWASKPAFDEHA